MQPSIHILEVESRYVDPGLDFDYIDGVARDVAAALSGAVLSRRPCEVAYQPGDMTFYGLVFLPLGMLATARPRVSDGRPWDAHAVRGMLDSNRAAIGQLDAGQVGMNALPYRSDGVLVCWLERGCYPLRFGNDRSAVSSDYVAEHFSAEKIGLTSAVSLALLFRAISFHMSPAPIPAEAAAA